MEISEKLLKYKVHILVTLASCVVVSTLVLVVAPRFVTIVAYFWPLLLSTALFLAAVIVFGRATAAAAAGDSAGDSAGEGLLDFVAGEPDHHLHRHHDDHRDRDDLGECDLINSDADDDIDEHKSVETSISKKM